MRLEEKHFKCIELLLAGVKRKDIADQLGVTTNTVYAWTQDADFAAEYQRIKEELYAQVKEVVASNLRDHVPNALATIVALSTGAQGEKVRLAASQDILDRAGFGAVQKQQTVVEVKFPPGTMELLRQVLQELDARTIKIPHEGVQPSQPVLLQ